MVCQGVHGGVCVSVQETLYVSVQETHVWCMDVLVPLSHVCVCNVHVCEYVCAMRYWYARAILPFLCPQGLGWGWLENQGRQNGGLELRDSATGVG